MDNRLDQLKLWLSNVLSVAEYEIQPASADASFRRYFRVICSGASYIAMDAPPDKEDSRPYLNIAQRWFDLGINVPEIFSHDLESGFLLISDLGNRTYLQELNAATVERLYGDAMGALIVLQTGTRTDPLFLPDYDRPLLMREMELFREWYLGRHSAVPLSDDQNAVLDRAFAALADAAQSQPQVWVHRDYHSRNLMVTTKNNPGVLDFQDAVLGPVTYDLVSLLRDCYIDWPQSQIESWVKGYHQLAAESGVPVCDDSDEFLRWFDLMGVQRHLKAIGIFARLNHRDHKPGYLADIPRTLAYVMEVSARYAELEALHGLLTSLPLVERK